MTTKNTDVMIAFRNEVNSRDNDSLSNILSCRNRWITNIQYFFRVFFTLNMFDNIFKLGTVLTGFTGFILASFQISQEQSLNNYALFFVALFTILKETREFVVYVNGNKPVAHNTTLQPA